MKNIIKFCSFCIILSFISCNGEDTFAPIVEIETPPHTPRLVIRADWSAGSDSLAVFVSRSKGVLDKAKANFSYTYSYWNGRDSIKYVQEYYDTVPNTKVELLRNGQLLGTIPYFNKGYHVSKKLYKLDTISGTVYTIRVSAPNFATVEASQKIQNRFTVLRGSYKADAAVSNDPFDPFSTPERGDELSFEFTDNANDENYYVTESPNQGRWGGTGIYVTRDSANKVYSGFGNLRDIDPNMQDGFLSDRAFSGKSYVWRFWLQPNLYFYDQTNGSHGFNSSLKKGDKVSILIRSASKDFALFIKTLRLARDAQDNPFFSEPVILHSNVKNGYGIFTIGSLQTVNFVIP
jgi:hypothetical protein